MLARPLRAAPICPSAPFLVPALLRASGLLTATRSYADSAHQHQRGKTERTEYYSRKWGYKRVVKTGATAARADADYDHADVQLFESFRRAQHERDLPKLMELYPLVTASSLLTRDHVRGLVQALHEYLRSRSTRNRPIVTGPVVPFLTRIVEDIKSRKLPPHPYAHVHLLTIYKESARFDEGDAFWRWLAAQDDSYLSPHVYGAAIELLASDFRMSRRVSLPDLEALYQDALKRFPGTFAEYHLSPDAIVPDRTQPTTISQIPMVLLQGILTARVWAADWKGAYLALDTGLRLYPTSLPRRFFQVLIEERPVHEGYTVLLMACRAGIVLNPSMFTKQLCRMRTRLSMLTSMRERLDVVRAMANAMYAYVEAGGRAEGPHLSVFFASFGMLLTPKGPTAELNEHQLKLRNVLVASVHDMASKLVQAGMEPHPQLFLALIQLAGKLNVPRLLSVTLQDVETARIDLELVGRRIVLKSAGLVGDKDLVESSWLNIAERAEREGSEIALVDWRMFANACRDSNHSEYFRQQLEARRHAIDQETEKSVLVVLESSEVVKDVLYDFMEPSEFVTELAQIREIVGSITAVIMSGQALDLQKTPFFMYMDPRKELLASLEDYRAVYDQFTTDPHQPAPQPQGKPVLSSTGIPLDELRFQNWVNIVELMNDAHEASTLQPQNLKSIPKPKLSQDELKQMVRFLRAPGRLPSSVARPFSFGTKPRPAHKEHLGPDDPKPLLIPAGSTDTYRPQVPRPAVSKSPLVANLTKNFKKEQKPKTITQLLQERLKEQAKSGTKLPPAPVREYHGLE